MVMVQFLLVSSSFLLVLIGQLVLADPEGKDS